MDGTDELLIDKYLSNKLTEQEREVFNQKMQDENFVKEVVFHENLKTAAIIEGREKLKEKLKKISQTNKPAAITIFLKGSIYPLAASLFFMVAISSLLYNISSYNSTNFSKRGCGAIKSMDWTNSIMTR